MPFRPPLSCPHSLPPSLSPLFFLSLFLLSVLALSLSLNQQMEMEVDKLEGVRQIPWSWGRRETDILVPVEIKSCSEAQLGQEVGKGLR